MTYYSVSLKDQSSYNLGNPHCLRRLLLLFISVVIPQLMHHAGLVIERYPVRFRWMHFLFVCLLFFSLCVFDKKAESKENLTLLHMGKNLLVDLLG